MNAEQKDLLGFAKGTVKACNYMRYVSGGASFVLFSCSYFMSAYKPATWFIIAGGFAMLFLALRSLKLVFRLEQAVDLLETYLSDPALPTKAWKNWLFRAFDKYDADNKTKLTGVLHGIVYNFDRRAENARKDRS